MNAVVVVAGGSGRRIGGAIPKQYLDLKGKAVVIHTLERFYLYDPQIKIVLVLDNDHRKFWDEVSSTFKAADAVELVNGGETRYDSVKNGLRRIPMACIVGIHDAVRPLVSLETISRCYSAARESGSGIPVMEMEESVRMIRKGGSENLAREHLRRVQTPQVFRSEQILEAYKRAYNSSFTDDASVYESVHGQVTLVPGNPENIKITKVLDLELASMII